MSLLWDVLEVTAVFLLAAEAIKVRNLRWIHSHTIRLHRVVNPKIEIVDELPKEMKFIDRYSIEFFLLGFFVFGVIAILTACRAFGIPLISIVPRSVGGWLILIFGIVTGPILVGLSAYTVIVWLLQRIVAALSWVEENTLNGAVGILGFILFLVQFIGRRVSIF
ncbi:MAG: hypothetical protein HQ567_06265 [Candidatus Nealsonbacteria bacterium]|nr:hypothetical protein [Candidatus Nealsonbacteria bacterium]